jgi:hypothetical protein
LTAVEPQPMMAIGWLKSFDVPFCHPSMILAPRAWRNPDVNRPTWETAPPPAHLVRLHRQA